MEMSDIISNATKWFDDEEMSVVVEALLPHKALVRDKEKAAERFFNLMELKYGGIALSGSYSKSGGVKK